MTANFIQTTDTWIDALDDYSPKAFSAKPSPGSWSIGQVYEHLIYITGYIFKTIRYCAATNENAGAEKTSDAEWIFENNGLPDILIQGPESNRRTPEPKDIEYTRARLLALKEEIKTLEEILLNHPLPGKSEHPGLGYFNAKEWFLFAEIHMRHHFRQKARIDEYLASL